MESRGCGAPASKHWPTNIFCSGTSSRRLLGLGRRGTSSLHTSVVIVGWFVGEKEKFSNKQQPACVRACVRASIETNSRAADAVCPCVRALHGLVWSYVVSVRIIRQTPMRGNSSPRQRTRNRDVRATHRTPTYSWRVMPALPKNKTKMLLLLTKNPTIKELLQVSGRLVICSSAAVVTYMHIYVYSQPECGSVRRSKSGRRKEGKRGSPCQGVK